MALYSLAENCEYGPLENEMIRDRLVVDIRDTALSERLQLNAELALEKAKKSIRQREAVTEQQTILDGANVDAMHNSRERGGQRDRQPGVAQHRTNRPPFKQNEKQQTSSPKRCTRCGKEPHTRSKCPAKYAVCHKCQKKDIKARCAAPRPSTDQRSTPSSLTPSTLQPKRRPGSRRSRLEAIAVRLPSSWTQAPR